jgi:hypothetical protein
MIPFHRLASSLLSHGLPRGVEVSFHFRWKAVRTFAVFAGIAAVHLAQILSYMALDAQS